LNSNSIVDLVNEIRLEANTQLDESKRGQLGQFMTPDKVSQLLAGMFDDFSGNVSLLDAGAGVGSLTSAFVERLVESKECQNISLNTFEFDTTMARYLSKSINLIQQYCIKSGIEVRFNNLTEDFISSAVAMLLSRENGEVTVKYNKAILNPPYLKIGSKSEERKLLRKVGIETGNLYSAFVALSIKLLDDGGELVAITPRSFCNGPYFKAYRDILLDGNNLSKIHVFESRTKAFKGDSVLQENVIFHIVKGKDQGPVTISSSACIDDADPIVRHVDFNDIVNPNNPDRFIHIVTTDEEADIATKIGGLPCSLPDLGIEVSTGKVVDFRTKENLASNPVEGSVPLIYPMHFFNGSVQWPKICAKKPNAILNNVSTKSLMVPNGNYVLTKRLTAKEENKRVVAVHYNPDITNGAVVGFENKTNYYHQLGEPLEHRLARGLTVFLNSSFVDSYFRQFNGHTQVNATDLRSLRYPTYQQLCALSKIPDSSFFDQQAIDEVVFEILFNEAEKEAVA